MTLTSAARIAVLALVVVTGWLALAASSASAASISQNASGCNPGPCTDSNLFYAGGSETNNLLVTQSGGTYRFQEMGPGATITGVYSICTLVSPTEATCPTTMPDGRPLDVDAHLSGGDDQVDMRTTRPSEINGGPGSDVLKGGSANDSIRGDEEIFIPDPADGADFIDGRGGADFMAGCGAANDTVSYVSRSTAVNVSLDNGANDGGFGEGDNVYADVEIVRGTSVGDTMTGNNSANQLVGLGGFDVLTGLGGPDRLEGGDTSDNIDGGAGNDAIFGEGGFDTLTGGADNDAIDGGEGNDGLTGGSGADDMTGGDASGPGTDSVDYRTYTQPLTVNVGDGQPNDGAAGEGDNVRPDIERVLGGWGNDRLAMGLPPTSRPPGELYGGEGDDTLTGGASNDLLEGQGGNDTLDGSYSADALNGGTGVDTVDYRFHAYTDLGTGEVVGSSISPNGLADDGNDQIDRDDETGGGDNVSTDVENVMGSDGPDLITGSPDANRLQGRGANDSITGGTANDVLQGGDGDDILKGDAGNDTFDGGLGADDMEGGADVDLVTYAGRTSNLAVRIDNNANDGDVATNERDNVRQTIENVRGGTGDDLLIGTSAANELLGDAGNDSLTGRLGADTLNGQAGVDTIVYSDRSTPVAVTLDQLRNDGSDPNGDAVSAAAEEGDLDLNIENADGGSGDDTLRALRGNAVVNLLRGLAGNDTLITRDGTATVDSLDCGAGGADEFGMDPSDVQTGCEIALP